MVGMVSPLPPLEMSSTSFRPDSWIATETVSESAQRQRIEIISVFCKASIRAQAKKMEGRQ